MQRQESTTHVLVVDNDRDIRLVLRDVLEEEGYAVTVAADGCTALAVMRAATRPLVVVLDQGLVGMTGTELMEAVLSDGQGAARAFLLLTASPDRLPAPLGGQEWQRVAPIMAKPFDLDALLEAVAAAARRLAGGSATAAFNSAKGQPCESSPRSVAM